MYLDVSGKHSYFCTHVEALEYLAKVDKIEISLDHHRIPVDGCDGEPLRLQKVEVCRGYDDRVPLLVFDRFYL